MKTLRGVLYDGIVPVAVPAELRVTADHLTLVTKECQEEIPVRQLSVSPRLGSAPRLVALPGGRQFSCADSKDLELLPEESPAEGLLFWLENRWSVAIAAIALLLGAATFGYFFGLPLLSEKVMSRVSRDTEVRFGKEALKQLDTTWFKPTSLSSQEQERIRVKFHELVQGLPEQGSYTLEFREAKNLGPNAFTLPGGILVVLDDLVRLADTDDEILAVMAHELGHAVLRHPVRSLLQGSVLGILATAVTHDAATLGGAVTNAPFLLASTRYSREFEAAADDFGFALLKKHQVSPLVFRSILQKMGEKTGQQDWDYSLFSTHPSLKEREEYAFQASLAPDHTLRVPDQHMAPSFVQGSRVKVLSVNDFKRPLERGDVVLTQTKWGQPAIKRVLGLPGDEIFIKDGKIHVSGTLLSRKPISAAECHRAPLALYGFGKLEGTLECSREKLGTVEFVVLTKSVQDHFYENTRVIAKDRYYLLEDNRTDIDSYSNPSGQSYMTLPSDAILGVVQK